MAVKHAKVSGKEDGPDETLVRPTDWNADHEGTNEVVDLKHTDDIDGVKVFFVTEYPYWSGSARIYLNGMEQWLGQDYWEVPGNTTIEMATAPEVGDALIIEYVKLPT